MGHLLMFTYNYTMCTLQRQAWLRPLFTKSPPHKSAPYGYSGRNRNFRGAVLSRTEGFPGLNRNAKVGGQFFVDAGRIERIVKEGMDRRFFFKIDLQKMLKTPL